MEKKNNILLSFDIDFTLIDNKKGIVNSFNYALNKYNLPKLKKSKIIAMIGMPLTYMFSKIENTCSDITPLKLSSAFREYYKTEGIFQARLIPGAKEKLEELKSKSFTLGVITSKKEEMAIKILEFFGIDHYFTYILGETEQRNSKTDPRLKSYLLKNFPGYKFIIIGDHPNDRALAEKLNCPFIGVLTGNHSAKQLKQNNIVRTIILNDVTEITEERIYSLF
ncbi:MAG: HAD family hydrolase [Promethearchaeota archaeon]